MGGTAAAVPPLAVGEGFQRGPPRNRSPLAAFFLRFLSTPERNRTAGGNLTKTLAEMKIARDLAGGNWTKNQQKRSMIPPPAGAAHADSKVPAPFLKLLVDNCLTMC